MTTPQSQIEAYLAQESTERVIRVATSDLDDWHSRSYGVDEKERCLLGHAFDVVCSKTHNKMMKEIGGSVRAGDHPGRKAEGEYMDIRLPERKKARVCIHLAWRELRSRNDRAAREFLESVSTPAERKEALV